MPKGVSNNPEETSRKLSKIHKGKMPKNFHLLHTPETAEKKRLKMQGRKPKNLDWMHERDRKNPEVRKRRGEAISKSKKGWIPSLTTRQRMSDAKKGVKLPQSHKKKISETHINNPNRKFKETYIELAIENELKRRSIVFEKQVPLCKIAIVDFYLPEFRTIIQADGCFWHGCLKCCPNSKIKDRQIRDIRQDTVLTFNGFNVFRFLEHEINKSVENCINKINV